MSGVTGLDGIQWERCNGCTEFVRIDCLRYENPSETYKHGRDLCVKCVKKIAEEKRQNALTQCLQALIDKRKLQSA